MTDALVGVDAKLQRADSHLAELSAAVEAFLGRANYRFEGKEGADPETGYVERVIFLEVDEFPRDESWGPIIGDAVHNLRSALDHLAWAVACPESRRRAAGAIGFPVLFDHPDESTYARDQLRGKLGHLRPEFHAVIEAVQPFNTRDLHHPLWLLNQMWNVDKHRTVHVSGFMFSDGVDDPNNAMGYASWQSPVVPRSTRRVEISRAVGTFNDRLEDQVQANNARDRDVALGRPDDPPSDVPWTRDYPFNNLPLRPVLRSIRTFVGGQVVEPARALLA